MALLAAKGIEKVYEDLAEPISVLRGVDLSVSDGETIGIFGASGAGKSTLLHVLGGLDEPCKGTILYKNEDIFAWDDQRRASFRNSQLGFVFQFYHLLSEMTALENVMIPALIAGLSPDESKKLAQEALQVMGLADRLDHRPQKLSGGEQQRVAIARAVVMKPKLLLADEPTGNLDRKSGDEVWNYLTVLREKHDMAVVIVSHNMKLIESLPIVYEMADGVLRKVKG